ncbi:Protein of unknown function [Propionibacterium cyclohexanicum]|uniref:DUF2993 domain-containing protein n=1 Tax=Propionibacterium cyclohexanicum TaxID=64702 RepID=A0A1H9PP24_9ACTN|nr:Protein of unknown function [Propionibacterium cyclohexanicum]
MLVVALVAAIIAFLAADQVVRIRAESRISTQVTSQIGSSTPVTVHLGGWPFLVSVARNELGSARLSIGSATLPVGSREVAVREGSVRVRGVAPIRNLSSASIGVADAQVVISWDTLTRLTGVQLSLAGEGQVAAQTTLSVLGTEVQARIVAGLRLGDAAGQLVLDGPGAQVAGVQVPPQIVSGAVNRLRSRLVLPALPTGLGYSGLSVDARGVTVDVHGEHLSLSQLR